ncbi:hypothetical protein BDZ89DRAFT_1045106 [Hymenopellis radicata]|nr:hypothetical protein BDZ89DRAFT_1045106 [Hymenopellis radicata]
MYSEQFPNNRKALKILETLFTVFMTIAAWNTFGSRWGDVNAILVFDRSWSPLPPLSSFSMECFMSTSGMAQSFYAWRIYRMTKSIWLVGLIELVMLMQLTATFDIAPSRVAPVDDARRLVQLAEFSHPAPLEPR